MAPVNAAATALPQITQVRKSGGYAQAEVAAWFPAQVTVTYTGTGYTTKTENGPVIWNTAAIGADFGGTSGEKTVSGTVDVPDWATGQKNVSISIVFVDKYILTDAQMNLSISGWTYGAQEKPVPSGSVSVADTNPVITWLYSADSGVSWTEAENKNYDGTLTATLKEGGKPVLSGVLTGDTVYPAERCMRSLLRQGQKRTLR